MSNQDFASTLLKLGSLVQNLALLSSRLLFLIGWVARSFSSLRVMVMFFRLFSKLSFFSCFSENSSEFAVS